MKKLFIVLIIVFATSCKKKESDSGPPPANGKAVIYTSNSANNYKYSVFFQGASPNAGTPIDSLGPLKYKAMAPTCEYITYVVIDKPPGTYYLMLRKVDSLYCLTPQAITITSNQCTVFDFH